MKKALLSWHVILGLAIVGMMVGCSKTSRLQSAAVHGSVFVYVHPAKDNVVSKTNVMLPLPDIKVYLRNASTGVESAPVKTDLYGRYLFPKQKPGIYELRWKAQNGWAAGKHPNPVVLAGNIEYPLPAQILPDSGKGVVFGSVTLQAGVTPWFYAELFSSKITASITVMDATGSTPLAGSVHANAWGKFAVAGLPRVSAFSVLAQSEAAQASLLLGTSGMSFGVPNHQIDLVLPNYRPEVITIVPEVGGSSVRTAAAGATIQLRALTRDFDGDPLQYSWKVTTGNGVLTPAGQTAKWQLPATSGRYWAYVQVRDGRGGYATSRVDFEVDKHDDLFSGKVVDQAGAPVSGALVTVSSGASTTTDAKGFFYVKAPLKDRYVLNISKRGYALFSRITYAGAMGQTWKLVTAQQTTVDPKKPIVVVDNGSKPGGQEKRGVKISVPANALVDSLGNPPAGMLTAYVATLNLAAAEAPGDWGAIVGGKETNLISYGTAFVEFLDAAGTKFNLKAGSRAKVEMPSPTKLLASVPASASYWRYDENDGFWKESGTATRDLSSGGFVGQVNHFSTINTDLSKGTASCFKVLLYPPLAPSGLKLRISDPTGAVFGQTFELILDQALNAVYRLPPNTDVKLELLNADGTPVPNIILEETPGVILPSNIVNTGSAIPAGNTLWPPQPYDDCKLVIIANDIASNSSVFLTFGGEGFTGIGTDADAQAYYAAADPSGLRLTFGAWLTTNGFTFDAADPLGHPTNADVIRTSFLNNNDLGSGRDMYFRDLGGGKVAAFVTNYGGFDQNAGNADLAEDRTAPGATVCMEYSPVEGSTTNIVKFFVFKGGGGGVAAPRATSADLDGFGEKFVPNLCLNCHGGDYTVGDPDLQAGFRELDLETYKFSGGRALPSELTAGELLAFQNQNTLVMGSATSTISRDAIKDLITNWYASGTTTQDNSWTPTAWSGSPEHDLYHYVVKTSCRTCHIGFSNNTTSSGLNWSTYDQLKTHRGSLSYYVLCDDRAMPHAATTYRNFWLAGSPDRPTTLKDYSDGVDWPAIGDCP